MSNLLPPLAAQKIIRIYRARLLLSVSFLCIGMGIAASVTLLPSYLIVEKNRATLSENSKTIHAPAANSADRDLLGHIQSRIHELSPFIATTSAPSDLIAQTLALRPAGVSIDHISYSAGNTPTILLTGTSKMGDHVSAYQRALAGNDHFAGVSVPVGALAGVNDGRFSITIIGK